MENFVQAVNKSATVDSEALLGAPWENRPVQSFPRIRESVEELIKCTSQFQHPFQKWAAVCIVKDIDDASLPAQGQTNLTVMSIIRVFPDKSKCEEFITECQKSFHFPMYPIPMCQFGRWPPPDNLERKYADEPLRQLFERRKIFANASSEALKGRVDAMRLRAQEEREKAAKREEKFNQLCHEAKSKEENVPLSAIEEEVKERKESAERIVEFEKEANRCEEELRREQQTPTPLPAPPNLSESKTVPRTVVNRLVPRTDLSADEIQVRDGMKQRFTDEFNHGVRKAEAGWAERVRSGQVLATSATAADAVYIQTFAGRFKWLPTKGPVLDDDLIQLRQTLVQKWHCPDPFKMGVDVERREPVKED